MRFNVRVHYQRAQIKRDLSPGAKRCTASVMANPRLLFYAPLTRERLWSTLQRRGRFSNLSNSPSGVGRSDCAGCARSNAARA